MRPYSRCKQSFPATLVRASGKYLPDAPRSFAGRARIRQKPRFCCIEPRRGAKVHLYEARRIRHDDRAPEGDDGYIASHAAIVVSLRA